MAKSRERVLQKYRERMGASGAEYRAGVQEPRRSWSAGYKASSDRMKAELLKAINENRHIQGVDRLGDANQQQITLQKAGNYDGAIDRAVENYGTQLDNVLAAGEAASRAANAMPNATLEQRIARSAAAQKAASAFWQNRR